MRKLILFIVSLAIFAILRYAYVSSKQIEIVKNQNSDLIIVKLEITSVDKDKLKQMFNENLSILESVLDKDLSSKALVNNFKSIDVIKLINKIIPKLSGCLIIENCSIDTNAAKNVLARNLEILKFILKNDSNLSDEIDWISIRQSSRISDDNVSSLAKDLLKNYNAENIGAIQILKIAKSYSGETKATFILNMEKNLLPDERGLFTSILYDSFENDDLNTVLEITKKMEKIKLNDSEIEKIKSLVCRFKNKAFWNEISQNLIVNSKQFEKICPQ